MKILITGATGFLGKALYSHLEENNIEVYGTSTSFQKDKNIFKVDISKKKDLKKLPNDIDIIVHLASIRENIKNGKINKKECFDINVKGTKNVLEFGKKREIKHFIYISSNTVYGVKKKKIKETDKPNPKSLYGMTKYASERNCEKICRKNNIKLTILRLTSIFGKNQGKFLINYIIECIKSNENIQIYGKGLGKWDFIYVKDAITVIENVINDRTEGIYNIGSGRLVSVNNVAKTCLEVYGGKSRIIYQPDKKENEDNILMDISKAKKRIGFEIKYDLKKALLDMKKLD